MQSNFQLSYRKKISLSFLLLFFLFATTVSVYQYQREKTTKIEQLETSLRQYSDIIYQTVKQHGSTTLIDSLTALFPTENLRITLIDSSGSVTFDNVANNLSDLDNHANRTEILDAKSFGEGYNVRRSKTTGKVYFYFAKAYPTFFIRSSVIYNQPVLNELKVDRLFIWVMAVIFIVFMLVAHFVSSKLGKSISILKDFAINAANRDLKEQSIAQIPNDELGIVANQIIQLYKRVEKSKNRLAREKEKLFNHFQHSTKGVAIFNKKGATIFVNTKFIHYITLILDQKKFDVKHISNAKPFKNTFAFIQKNLKEKSIDEIRYFSENFEHNSYFFEVSATIFYDKSYEISISDTTVVEKNRIMKQEMTGNIAHELKTPVSIMNGYIETLLHIDTIEKEKQNYFLERCQKQIVRLTNTINDIAIVSKLEDSPNKFSTEKISLKRLLTDISKDFELLLKNQDIRLAVSVSEKSELIGNPSLLYSVFQNLIDNSMKYGGKGISIKIKQYMEDENFYYFSYSDSGEGIEKQHLNRLFERFYRVDAGRSRNSGGTGLGLAIVKNVIQFHNGEITAKIPKQGGLEFLFTLKKRMD